MHPLFLTRIHSFPMKKERSRRLTLGENQTICLLKKQSQRQKQLRERNRNHQLEPHGRHSVLQPVERLGNRHLQANILLRSAPQKSPYRSVQRDSSSSKSNDFPLYLSLMSLF